MAEVTYVTPTKFEVFGRRRVQFYNVSGTGSSDTITTGLQSIFDVNVQDTATAVAQALSVAVSGGTVTITANSAYTSVPIMVTGN